MGIIKDAILELAKTTNTLADQIRENREEIIKLQKEIKKFTKNKRVK